MALKYPKNETVNISRVLIQAPCVLFSVVVTAAGGGTGIINIRNGGDVSSPLVLPLYVSSPDSKPFSFPEGLYLSRGCYIEIVQYIQSVLVTLKQLE